MLKTTLRGRTIRDTDAARSLRPWQRAEAGGPDAAQCVSRPAHPLKKRRPVDERKWAIIASISPPFSACRAAAYPRTPAGHRRRLRAW